MIKVTPDVALQLPIDELALFILADLAQPSSSDTNKSEYNYTLQYRSDSVHGYRENKPAQKAIAEAVGWLRARGLIACTPATQHSYGALFITRRGQEALKMSVLDVRAIDRLQDNLHPLIERNSRRQFLLGEYENAIFGAMRVVEIRVRSLAGFGDDVFGSDLMTKAFRKGGPLADPAAPQGEVEGTMMLFKGAYAVLRNPSGHREVSFDDVTEASEAVLTASLLMRMLDKIEKRLSS
ncbi:TIGR02391 family protein [Actinomadura formosensis]|uniref:TIGR02391 family protein n=1 Tax=Actinomadura formosensis TaxID=60706 RepID=UPI000A0124E5|nr:TIGR02391 family protein [Actinomadura formosensis]